MVNNSKSIQRRLYDKGFKCKGEELSWKELSVVASLQFDLVCLESGDARENVSPSMEKKWILEFGQQEVIKSFSVNIL